MSEAKGPALGAPRDVAQPSLWDRVASDLPEVAAEIADLRRDLAVDLGAERLGELVAGGGRATAEAGSLPADRERLARLARLERRRAELSARSVVVSPEVLREAVRRDLEMLFSTHRYECRPLASGDPTEHSLEEFPEVQRSVLNFGTPTFVGRAARDFDWEALARELRSILAVFEPRLRPSATRVTVSPQGKSGTLAIEIDGLLVLTPVPERLRLRTMIDLDSGRARTSIGEA